MKKLFLAAILAVMGIANASAQFEKGKFYGGASASGLGISYSETTKFAFGFDALGGYLFANNWMAMAELGYNFHNSDTHSVSAGLRCRYYIVQNGLFLSLGAKYLHEFSSYNDFFLTPEVGYCFFLNRNVTLEPSIYYNMSLTDFGNKSRFGLKVGFGFFF
ncbi:MAG: outer membrane beta-barrel protein [Bacteroidaceae bacterium]|nr:outer membrane beta-barrel protein [Bacteroidaceae bacterium]